MPRLCRTCLRLVTRSEPALAGSRTIEGFIPPTIAQAAAVPGGHDHIIAMVAVAVTDDVDAARTAADRLALYDSVPSNQKVNAGGSRATELAVVGTAEAVTRQLKTYIAAGATDVVLEPLQTGLTDLRRVWDMAAAF